MKICLVQQHPIEPGKTPAAILRYLKLAEHFSTSDQVILILPAPGMKMGQGEFNGLPCYHVPTPGTGWKWLDMLFFAVLLLPVLWQVSRRESPDVWFVDELFVGLALPWLRLFDRSPVNYDVMGIHYYQVRKHNSNLLRHWLLGGTYALLERLTIMGSTFLTTVNEAHREALRRWTRKPVYVIRDAAEFLPPTESDEEVSLPSRHSGEVWLTFIGKLSNRRLDDLFEILPGVVEECRELRVLIVGDGPFRERYHSRARQPQLTRIVHFHDFVPHSRLPEFAPLTDIAYSDDWSDIGFPMKVFEYMHLGLAMLVEDTDAVREVLRQEENALLYSGQKALRAGLIRLVKDSELRRQLGEQAALEASQHSWEKRKEQFMELYNRYACGERNV